MAPEMLVELTKVEETDSQFVLHLGKITEKKNTHLLD
jgi:hypothetical protein